jgi:hypothetical protein
MSHYRDDVRVLIDPEQSEELDDGGRLQDVSLIMVDGPRRHSYVEPSVCTLSPTEARELAFELLVAAEHAEQAGAER